MNHNNYKTPIYYQTIMLALLAGVSSSLFAQSSTRFSITRNVVAGGGTTVSSSARFQLASTIAQPLAAVPSSARFSIQGGFWIQPAPILFAPMQEGSDFMVSIQSELGATYTIQYLNTLGSTWQYLTTLAGTGSIITVTNSALGIPQRFYRLVEQ
jgi:hypothetical protein